MDDKKIAELKATHGEHLALVEVDGHDVVFKKPTRAQFNRFREAIAAGQPVAAGGQLLMDTLVAPDWKRLVALIEDAPALEDELVGEVTKLAKSAQKISAKKL
jgi:hypothetical protein